MENHEKSIGEYVKEVFVKTVRLVAGMDEEEPRIVISPEPVTVDIQGLVFGYWACIILFVVGVLAARLKILGAIGELLGAIGFISLLFYFIFMLGFRRKMEEGLEGIKFKLKAGVDDTTLFNAVHPALVSKYGMQLERIDGSMIITYDNMTYHVLINEDNTFRILFLMKEGILPTSRKKRYQKKTIAMGIIAYEIQKAFSVNENKNQVSEV